MQCIITSVLTNQIRDEVTQWLSDIFRIFFNFLGQKNEVYGKLKPLQEKVKYMFFSKLYYSVSRKKKSSQKTNPAIGIQGSKRGHFLTIKMVVTKKYEFSCPKGICSPVRIGTGVFNPSLG